MSTFPSIDEMRSRPNINHLYVEFRIQRTLNENFNLVEIREDKWPEDPNFIEIVRGAGYKVVVREQAGKGYWGQPHKVYIVSW